MMTPCADCSEWAQWAARSPIREADPKKPGKTKIVGWELVSHLCGKHKQAMEEAPSELELHFAFVGAVPLGAQRT